MESDHERLPSATSNDYRSDAAPAAPQEGDAAAQFPSASINESSDGIKRNPDVDVLAKGIAAVLGPVMNNFDGGVEGALKSQSILASSIDRLTRELDKLLEDVPLPFATQHATRISGARKRILSLNTSLRIIQRRMNMIERLLAGYASKPSAKEKSSVSVVEGSHSRSHDIYLMEVPPIEALSCGSADNYDNGEDQLSRFELSEISDLPGGLQEDHVQEESLSLNYKKEFSKQGANDDEESNNIKTDQQS